MHVVLHGVSFKNVIVRIKDNSVHAECMSHALDEARLCKFEKESTDCVTELQIVPRHR